MLIPTCPQGRDDGTVQLFLSILAVMGVALIVVRRRRHNPNSTPSAVVATFFALVCVVSACVAVGGLIFAGVAVAASHRPGNQLAGVGVPIGLTIAAAGTVVLVASGAVVRAHRRD